MGRNREKNTDNHGHMYHNNFVLNIEGTKQFEGVEKNYCSFAFRLVQLTKIL